MHPRGRGCLPAFALLILGAACAGRPAGNPASLPNTPPGIGFDDLRYSAALGKLLVPAGRTGALDLLDPDTMAVTAVSGFSATGDFSGGHDDGPTSADEARGIVMVTDRTSQQLVLVDPARATIVAHVSLGGPPDYVRAVPSRNEIWVTEPGAERIEIFSWANSPGAVPVASGELPVPNGPESLVIDEMRGRAYSHRWQRSTVALDLRGRQLVAEWPNGCAASRGIALDEKRGFLFVACSEGTVSVLDVRDGSRRSTFAAGSGFDVIGYNPALGHLYLAGSACGCLIIAGVSDDGQLSLLERKTAPHGTHCAVADDRGNAWLCDPDSGRVWRVKDSHGSSAGR